MPVSYTHLNIKDCVNLNPEVIRPIDNPYSQTGGLAVLKGNLAPDGGVVKRSAVVEEMMVHEGPARVFAVSYTHLDVYKRQVQRCACQVRKRQKP